MEAYVAYLMVVLGDRRFQKAQSPTQPRISMIIKKLRYIYLV